MSVDDTQDIKLVGIANHAGHKVYCRFKMPGQSKAVMEANRCHDKMAQITAFLRKTACRLNQTHAKESVVHGFTVFKRAVSEVLLKAA